jgi:uncharacterized membrane protein
MVKKIKATLILLTFLLVSALGFGQYSYPDRKVSMADTMRSNGKIYVVVAVLVIILLGLILYIARIDRKIGKLEKSSENNK